MERGLVSIIIPTFNRAHLISDTLDSIIAQKYKKWECIIVDDGSLDDTKSVVENYIKKDSRFKYLERPNIRQKGANACRNFGFENSAGEYINWFDSDDLMMPKKLELQVKQLKNENKNFSVCQTMMYDVEIQKNIGLRANALVSKDILNDYITYKIFWLTNAPLWKKEKLIANDLKFDESLHQSQDYDFHIRALLKNMSYCFINDPLVVFRKHLTNMSVSSFDTKAKLISNLKVKNDILTSYRSCLKLKTLKFTYKEILKLYKTSLKNKKYGNSLIVLYYLLSNIKTLELPIFKNFKLSVNLILAFISFSFFSKGEKFLKFEI